jgi:hypothetical protein
MDGTRTSVISINPHKTKGTVVCIHRKGQGVEVERHDDWSTERGLTQADKTTTKSAVMKGVQVTLCFCFEVY